MEPHDSTLPFSTDGEHGSRRHARHQQRWLDELDAILSDESTTDLETFRARVQAQLGRTRAALSELSDSTGDLAHEARQCAETYVHDRPWHALTMAAGVGLAVGVLLGRH